MGDLYETHRLVCRDLSTGVYPQQSYCARFCPFLPVRFCAMCSTCVLASTDSVRTGNFSMDVPSTRTNQSGLLWIWFAKFGGQDGIVMLFWHRRIVEDLTAPRSGAKTWPSHVAAAS